MFPRVLRTIDFKGCLNGKVSTGMFNNEEHLIVPVVALVEGVIWPMNAEAPELVLASELEEAPWGWNGRPVVVNHPMIDDNAVSANIPAVLEVEQFGLLFNTYVEKKKLKTEAWLSPSRAEIVGDKALRMIERAQNGDDIEISVGVYVTPEEAPGVFQGVKYKFIWRGIVQDHLALLEEGQIGACSIEMGCGAPRVARFHILSANKEHVTIEERSMPDLRPAARPADTKKKTSFLTRLRELSTDKDNLISIPQIRVGTATFDMSDSDAQLRQDLDAELRAVVPGFMYVEGVSMNDGLVLYSAMPRDDWKYYTHEFAVRGGTVKLKGSPVEVEPVTRFEPIGGESEPKAAAAPPCGCQTRELVDMATIKERVKALIDSKKNTFTTAHASVLETMSDAQLKALEEADTNAPEPAPAPQPPPTPPVSTQPPAPPAPATEAPVKDASARQVTLAEWEKTAPPEVVSMVNEFKAASSVRRNGLVSMLKTAQSSFSEDDLKAMPLDQLEKTAALCRVETSIIDYSGLGMPRINAGSKDESPEPAPSLRTAVAARAGLKINQ